jgi:CheY-like chemotaxis protein
MYVLCSNSSAIYIRIATITKSSHQEVIVSVDEVAKLIEAVTKLAGALVWPGLVLFVLIRFGPALKEFFEGLGEFSFKGAGFEASAKRKQAEAVAALAAAAAARPEPGATPESTARDAREAAELVAEAVTPRILRKARRATVLWVDDRPDNNLYERQSLEAIGVSFVLAKSTEEALDKMRSQRFDAIISDMGRPPDPRAGYTLLDKLRSSGNNTPFIIYAGSNAPEHKAEARKHGALGSTNRASELFEYVLSALRLVV